MNNEPLISELTQDLEPVRPLSSPFKRALAWITISLFSVGTSIAILGVRMDWQDKIADPRFLFEFGLLLSGAFFSALSAFILSVPGRTSPWVYRFFPILTLLIWSLILFVDQMKVHGDIRLGVGCIGSSLVMGVIPAITMFLMVRRGAVTQNHGLSGVLSILSIAIIGALATQFTCHKENPMHLILWHLSPVLVIASTGIWVGKKFLRLK